MRLSNGTIGLIEVTLQPILPSWNRKYVRQMGRGVSKDVRNTQIPPFTRVSSLLESGPKGNSDFEGYIHPEGDRYWHSASKHVVTPNDPNHSPHMLELLLAAYKAATELIPLSGQLDGGTLEVFLNVEGDPALVPINTVEYCFIDHESRQVFWAETVDVAKMGLEPFSSNGALRSTLTPEYWTHVEYFPMHRNCDVQAENELISVLRFGFIDDSTAPGSISAYSASQCADYLKILEGFRTASGGNRDGYRTVSLARLWSSIGSVSFPISGNGRLSDYSAPSARIRHIHSYGLPDPRLDRLQGLSAFVKSQSRSSLVLSFWEAACFYVPLRTFRRLSELWNGRVVYERHWRVFFEDTKTEWLVMGGLGLVCWIASAMVLSLGGANVAITASASFAMGSVLISLLLLNGHSKGRLATAPQLSSYIVQLEDYYHGLRPLSIVFSLPLALTIYSAMLLQAGLVYKSLGTGSGSGNHSPWLTLAVWVLPILVPTALVGLYGGVGVL